MLRVAKTARTWSLPITAVATGIVPSAKARRRSHGWRSARPNCWPFLTSTSCSRCRCGSGPSPTRTRPSSTDLLFKACSQTMLTIAADPKRLGVKIGFTTVLYTWGSTMTHHPHVHMIVPGGGISLDGTRWIGCRPKYLLPVKVLSRLFRRLMLEMLFAAHDAGLLSRRPRPPRRHGRIQGLSRAAASDQVVRLQQAAVRRAGAGAGLSVPLHAPGRDLQQPQRIADASASRSGTRTTGSRGPAATKP